jgi:hypothetical protein
LTIRLPHKDDLVLGTTAPPLPFPQVRLTPKDQAYHATIWGRTGSGKSKLLQSVFLQHLNKGHGVGLLEPHHDLSFDTLTYLVSHGFFRDERSFERLVYLDWGNGDFVPFNVLAGSGDPHTIALNALEGMLRVWPELVEAPLFQQLFLAATYTLTACGYPLTFLYPLLTQGDFRAKCLERVDDRLIHEVFVGYDKLGREQVQAAGSTLRRAFLLSFSPLARLTLGQPDMWLNFRKIMDEGKSIIINLGNIGDHETRTLLGALIMVQIEQAALSRTDLAPAARVPFNLLVDEWPSFAAQDNTIGTILSQTRKFNLRLWLAGQSLSQVSSERLTGAIENCRLSVVFGLGRDSAAMQARHIGRADPMAIREEALTATQHALYLSTVEQFEQWTQELQNLPPRTAYVKLHDQPATKITTLTVPEAHVNPRELDEVLTTYRRQYQRTQAEAEAAIAKLSTPPMVAEEQEATPAITTLFRRRSKGKPLSN